MTESLYHSIIKYNAIYPNTYLILLPKDLQNLLTKYYFGPLELSISYYSSMSQTIKIKRFDNNGKMDTVFILYYSITHLLENYERQTKSEIVSYDSRTIFSWDHNIITIKRDNDQAQMFLYDYMKKLFWEKVNIIVNQLREFFRKEIDNREINRYFSKTVF